MQESKSSANCKMVREYLFSFFVELRFQNSLNSATSLLQESTFGLFWLIQKLPGASKSSDCVVDYFRELLCDVEKVMTKCMLTSCTPLQTFRLAQHITQSFNFLPDTKETQRTSKKSWAEKVMSRNSHFLNLVVELFRH